MIRAAALVSATLALAGCGFYAMTRSVQGPTAGIQPDALNYALNQVCLPAVTAGRPSSDFARPPHALPMPMRRVEGGRGYRAGWHVGPSVYVVPGDGGTCVVSIPQGRPELLDELTGALLRTAAFELEASDGEIDGEGLRRRWCLQRETGVTAVSFGTRRAPLRERPRWAPWTGVTTVVVGSMPDLSTCRRL